MGFPSFFWPSYLELSAFLHGFLSVFFGFCLLFLIFVWVLHLRLFFTFFLVFVSFFELFIFIYFSIGCLSLPLVLHWLSLIFVGFLLGFLSLLSIFLSFLGALSPLSRQFVILEGLLHEICGVVDLLLFFEFCCLFVFPAVHKPNQT